ncbi:MAG: DUF5658 family protein [Dehalococcoidales bacterium]|jgi:hypothetical protein
MGTENLEKKTPAAGKKMMLVLLASLVTLVVLDGALTEYLIPGGRVREANPFLEPLVGKAGFMILKVVGASLCAWLLWDVYRRYPKVGTIAAWVAVLAYGAIVIWNTSLILLV